MYRIFSKLQQFMYTIVDIKITPEDADKLFIYFANSLRKKYPNKSSYNIEELNKKRDIS